MGTVLALAVAPGLAQGQEQAWDRVPGTPPDTRDGARAYTQPEALRAFELDAERLDARLAEAPEEDEAGRAVISLPAPGGGFERFAIEEAPIMEPGLARKHPDITTYSGQGLDDPEATLRASDTPLGFHASVRSPRGAWYVEPYYHLDDSLYASYFGRDLERDDAHANFLQKAPVGSDPDPLGLDVGSTAADEGRAVRLRTYRLALLTDPSYATFFGGPGNVTAAKVVLMNRVNQIYEDETAIRLVLIAENDDLNLDTPEQMTGANGPCGASACFTPQLATSCGGATLNRTRIVIGQLVGAAAFDIGHIALGTPGGGIAGLGVVGGDGKARGCTGLPTPIGDFFAVDYVAHEMGHQFAGNHTFNGTVANCAGGNRSAANSVEPGSGSSIMAYAGICGRDNLQPHSDPYWSQRSFQEITTYVSADRPPISEAQTISLRGLDTDGESFTLTAGGEQTPAIVRGVNYSPAGIAAALQGPSDAQRVALEGFDADGESFHLAFRDGVSVPLTRGQNYTPQGVQAAVQGGNEQQQVALAGFDPAAHWFRIRVGDVVTPAFGAGGLPVTNGNLTAAVTAITGAGTAAATGASPAGFTLQFAGATDVPSVAVECSCDGATVREIVKGTQGIPGRPAGLTAVASDLSDAGFTLTLAGAAVQGTDVDEVAVAEPQGLSATVTELVAGGPGVLPVGATVAVTPWAGTGAFDDAGFGLSFGGVLAGRNLEAIELTDAEGLEGYVGETAQGGPVENQGTVGPTANRAPTVTAPAPETIPVRTPFALTGSARDADGDTLTYLWEQNDRGGLVAGPASGTALLTDARTNGPLFRQFGTSAAVTPQGTLQTPSPGLNAVTTDPQRVFPDLAQVVAGNTNAETGFCPAAAPAPAAVSPEVRDCFSELLPTADYSGFLGDRTLNFRLTARDGHPGAGGVSSADTALTLDPTAGPFLVTSQAEETTVRGGATVPVTWDVAGTDRAPIGVSEVRITLSTDGGATFGEVLAAATPNDGAAEVRVPNVAANARLRIEAVGNVFFAVADADLVIDAGPAADAAEASVQYSDAPGPEPVLTVRDANSAGSSLTATATGLPEGLSLAVASTSEDTVRPGVRAWRLTGRTTAAPGTYRATVAVADETGAGEAVGLTVVVRPEDARITYTGGWRGNSPRLDVRVTLRDAADGSPGDITRATLTVRAGGATVCGPVPVPASGVVECSGLGDRRTFELEAGGFYQGVVRGGR